LLLFAPLLCLVPLACNDDFGAAPGETSSAASGGGAESGAGLPCEVDAVLASHCRGCHSDPPRYGAPMPLTKLADLHAPAKSDPTRTVAELVPERLDDPASPMPPSGDLPAADRQALLDWLGAGAPAYDGPDCGTTEVEPPEVGPDALDCEVTHRFTAHAVGDDSAPYQVPELGAENLYQCFTFKSPFDGVRQGTAWAPIVDDERVLHHWILYRTQEPQPDGGVMPCQMPSDATFVSGWAPGGLNYVMPEDVGFELGGPDDYFILQIHYHNVAHYDDALDASGVALCTTEAPRPHLAGVLTLGTVAIDIPPYANGYQTSGLCPSWITSNLTEPLHIIASFPHMHELGTEIRTDVMRGSDTGPLENLVHVDPWQFDDQRFYPHDPPMVFNPGDATRTTCTYDNPNSFNVTVGEKTEDEMCFNFVMLYPIDALGENRTCVGLF
jgi:hypothetical protein